MLEDVEVLEGRAARLDCKISGTPPPSVTWTHFGTVPHSEYADKTLRAKIVCAQRAGPSAIIDLHLCPPPGLPVNESENVRLRQDGGLHSLHIAHVGSEDEGFYEVSATNTHGQAHCSAQLYVEEPRTAASGPRYHLGAACSASEGPFTLSQEGITVRIWVAMWFLQLEAGENAIHP